MIDIETFQTQNLFGLIGLGDLLGDSEDFLCKLKLISNSLICWNIWILWQSKYDCWKITCYKK
uniref:Uncharacterized protein n=1 Tax=Rhizophora mucronata TaxID=61149 RepID=A0A2P2NPR4_RHIMU